MARYKYFKFDQRYYTPEVVSAGGKSQKEYNREYDKLYGEAERRISKLVEKGYGDRAVVDYYNKVLKPRGELQEGQFPRALNDLHRFLNRTTNTATDFFKQDSQFLKMLRERGINVQRSKLGRFYDYLDRIKESQYGKLYDSERAMELIAQAIRLDIDVDSLLDNFREYDEHLEELSHTNRRRNAQNVDYLEIAKRKRAKQEKNLFQPDKGKTRRASAEKQKKPSRKKSSRKK